jgi:hypothetical protein
MDMTHMAFNFPHLEERVLNAWPLLDGGLKPKAKKLGSELLCQAVVSTIMINNSTGK